MYVNATLACSRARACTIARPMPRLPPVTMAVLPENMKGDLATKGTEITKTFFHAWLQTWLQGSADHAIHEVRKRQMDLPQRIAWKGDSVGTKNEYWLFSHCA